MGEIKQFRDYKKEQRETSDTVDIAAATVSQIKILADTILEELGDLSPIVFITFIQILEYKYQIKHPEIDLGEIIATLAMQTPDE